MSTVNVTVGTPDITVEVGNNLISIITNTQGPSGLGIVWQGAYNGATAYVVEDAVSYNGSSYICILNSTGNLPTNGTYWEIIASKGDTGATGATGAQGIQGIQGETGATGAAGPNTVTTSTTTNITGLFKGNGSTVSAAAAGTDYAAPLGADDNYVTDAEKTKIGYISITQAVDLDTIESRVNALDAAVVLKGSWDASAGTFPGSGAAQAGDSYIVSIAGTVDSIAFNINDRLLAITDNASTITYATNWLKLDYTDQVLSVNGMTGAVTIAETATTIGALIGGAGDATPNNTDYVATSLTAGGILKKITWTNVKAFLKTYFDTLYPSGSGTSTGTNTGDQAWVKKTTTYTAVSGNYILADTSGGAFTITLPASPATNSFVTFKSGISASTNNLTIGRNSQTIMGLAEDMTVSTPNLEFTLVFDGTTWKL